MIDAGQNDFLLISDCFKASPAEEAGRRFIYLEAANEAADLQNEVVLAKALGESKAYFLRFGNLDLDHVTQVGPKRGITNYAAYEIGRPVDVRVNGPAVFVKGEIFSGDGEGAKNANLFWDSLTRQKPAQRWYPSVAGKIQNQGPAFDAKAGQTRNVIRAVRWTNIGFSKTPVNDTVPTVATVPFGVLAKAWDADGLDLLKALEAGYGTDSATLTGGAALREQSLDPVVQSYWDFRERLAGDVRARRVGLNPSDIIRHAAGTYHLDAATAGAWTEKFLGEVKSRLSQSQKKGK